ncbi:MAG TPA: hypothetical protein DD638_05580 [Pasteurellaceae bacterium]|nr:hypothetical protein [Pasteurellaceae bacterium]
MKISSKIALVIGMLGLFSANVMATQIPKEIYKPRDAKIVKADRQGNGEFEAEFRLHADKTNVRDLAKRVISHALDHDFSIKERKIKNDDADLKFKRGKQELDVSIELKDKGRIEYKADLDLDKN